MPQMHCNFFSYSLGHGVDLTITLPGVSPCDMDDPARTSDSADILPQNVMKMTWNFLLISIMKCISVSLIFGII